MTTLVRREVLRLADQAPQVREGEAARPESRIRSFVASDESVDRYNTTIRAEGWQLDNFRRNPVILFGHNSRDWPIGKGSARVEGKRLLVDVEFFPADVSPTAEQALRVLDLGVMGVSVGFSPIEYVYAKERESEDPWENLWSPPLDYVRQELLEVSVVTIGANPAAVPVGRQLLQERLELSRRDPGQVPVAALARLVPELVAGAIDEATAELRANRARRTGRISGR